MIEYNIIIRSNLILSLIICAFALGEGFSAIGQYRRLSSISLIKPSEEILGRIRSIVEPIFKAKVKKQEDYIELYQIGGKWNTHWKAKLDRPHSIFVNRNTGQIFFLRPEEYNITLRGKLSPNKQKKFWFQIKDSNYKAIVGPISWQRYDSWVKSL